MARDLLGEDSKLNELCGGRVEVSIEDLIARRAPQFGKRPQTGRCRYDTGMTASDREIAEQEGWRDFQHEGSGPNTSSFTRTGGCGWERGWKRIFGTIEYDAECVAICTGEA